MVCRAPAIHLEAASLPRIHVHREIEPNTFRTEPFNIFFFKSGQIVRFGYQHLNTGTAQPFTQRDLGQAQHFPPGRSGYR